MGFILWHTTMLSSAAHQTAVYAVNFGVAIDSEYFATCMTLIESPEFQNDYNIDKFNINGTAVPAISKGKNFDPNKPAYIGVQLATKGTNFTKGVWAGLRCINLTLTNTEPKTNIEKSCPKFVKMFDTNYKEFTSDSAKAVIAELEKVCK